MTMLETIRAGKAVDLYWTVTRMQFNAANASVLPSPYDPPDAPAVTIIDPNGATQVNALSATKDDGAGGTLPAGLWRYTYVTPADGAAGVWSAWIDAIDGSGVPSGSVDAADQVKATPVFRLV
jgi:hypothetical protein